MILRKGNSAEQRNRGTAEEGHHVDWLVIYPSMGILAFSSDFYHSGIRWSCKASQRSLVTPFSSRPRVFHPIDVCAHRLMAYSWPSTVSQQKKNRDAWAFRRKLILQS